MRLPFTTQYYRCFCLPLFSVILLSACSKSPTQYQNEPPRSPEPQLGLTSRQLPETPTNPDGGKIDGRILHLSAEYRDAKKREGSLEPIILGKGAAGITFNTTIQDSRNILSEEIQIADVDPFELHVYPEGIAVQWDQVSTQKPEIIIVLGNYQGKIVLPKKYAGKEIKLGSSLSDYFTPDDPQAMIFFNELYKFMQNLPANSPVNCFTNGQCQVLPQPEARSIIYMLGASSAIVLSDDSRKALSMVLLTSNLPLLNFRNPDLLPPNTYLTTEFDLATGILSDSEVDTVVQLGDPFKNIPELLRPSDFMSPKIYLDQFQLAYRGGQLNYGRSHFERTYLTPEPREFLQSIIITPAGNDAHDIGLTIKGRSYVLRANGLVETKKPKYKRAPDEPMPLPLGTKFYSKGFDQDRQVKTNFVRSLSQIMNQSYSQDFAEAKDNVVLIPPTVNGAYSDQPTSNFIGQTGYIDLANKRARLFEVLSTYNNITVIYSVSDFINPIDVMVLKAEAQPVKLGGSELAGFKIGDEIQLSEIDRGMDQATLIIDGVRKRINFKANQTLKTMSIVASSGRAVEANLNIDEVSFLGLTLGVTQDDQKKMRIVSITSQNFNTAIEGLCDAVENVTFTMSQFNFLETFKKTDPKVCSYYAPASSDDVAVQSIFYFPAKRAKVEFSDHQLSRLTIY